MTQDATTAGLAIIADDEDTGRVLLVESVSEVGLRSLSFANGSDALAAALANDVSIVLLDVDMPGMNGYEVCRRPARRGRLCDHSHRHGDGHEDSAAITLAFEAGATDFVSKPVNWALLSRRLEYMLLRWPDAEYGDISPTRFVEIAEDSGLILDMSGWVVRAVCRQLRKWLDRGITMPVAINCSGKELLHGDPAHVLETEASAAGVPASLIEIELTESLLIKDSATVQGALKRLRQLGRRIVLDDFGTGYSSLAYITRFPPDRIKIDQAFVRDLDRSPGDAAIANAILSLAASLNLVVTAEGVERQEQLDWLRARGCHEVQGFLLSKPLSAADFEARFFPGGRKEPLSPLQRAS